MGRFLVAWVRYPGMREVVGLRQVREHVGTNLSGALSLHELACCCLLGMDATGAVSLINVLMTERWTNDFDQR